jgi:hypothetical protein
MLLSEKSNRIKQHDKIIRKIRLKKVRKKDYARGKKEMKKRRKGVMRRQVSITVGFFF